LRDLLTIVRGHLTQQTHGLDPEVSTPRTVTQLAHTKIKETRITQLKKEPSTIHFKQVLEHDLGGFALVFDGKLDP
jgi:hypothetical protein